MTVEVILELPRQVEPLSAVRSTLIQSSLNTLRQRGHYPTYLELVDPRWRQQIVDSLAPEWLPIELAHAHYAACDALKLTHTEQLEIGASVGDQIQGTFIGTLVKRARTIGLTPWVPLGQFQRLWERLLQGGAVGMRRTGLKDAEIEMRNLTLARYSYFRAAFCGLIASGIKLGAGRAVHVRVAEFQRPEQRVCFKAQWV
jgi:hypothetical protein